MPDLAELGIRVTSQEVATADDRLDDLTRAAGRAEDATDKLAMAARRSDGAVGTMSVALRQQRTALDTSRSAMGLTTMEGLNLSRQFADIGVTAAMGMNPLMIALQQGPQLLDIFQTAAIRTGSTVGSVARAAGAAIWTVLAPILPVVLAIGAAAGALAAGWGLATRSLSSDIGNVGKELNLTEQQMERLKDKGESTTATAGDAFKALGTTIKEVFQETFGPQLDWVSRQWNSFLTFAGRVAIGATASIAAAFIGSYYAIRDNWRNIPAIIGDAAVSAANVAVRAAEFIINKGSQGINTLLTGLRGLAGINPAFGWANAIGNIGTVSLGAMANPFSGSMSSAADNVGAGYVRAFGQATGAMQGFYDRWKENTEDTARTRIRDAAGDAGRDGGAGSSRDRQEREVLQKLDVPALRGFGNDIIKLEEPLLVLARELRLVDSLAQEAGRGMAESFGEAGRAMSDLLTAMTGYQLRLAEIDLAEKEHRLSGAQAARERGAAEVQAYGSALSAAKGFFREGSDGYKALQAAEQVYRAYQFAMTIQSMLMGGQETAFTVGQNLIRSASHGVVAIARALASLPFPLNLAAGVATAAALAAIGVKLFGGGGGKSGSSVSDTVSKAQSNSAQDAQSRQSAASVMAQSLKVAIEFDDPMFRARVTREAAPLAAGAYQGSVQTSREAIPAEQTQKAGLMLRTGRR